MFGTKPPIGVDIGSHTIKVCQLRRNGEGYELEKFGQAEIYPNGDRPSDGEAQRQAKIEALRRAMEQGQIKAKTSVSAICGESIIVRYLQLPEMPADELKKALQWEAEEYIPFRLSEVNLDSMILGHSRDGDHNKMDVLLVSAKKDMVAEHVSVLKAAGLEPQIVDVDSFAFLNCYELNHQPQTGECSLLVNIGGEVTSINIYNNGASRFSRDIPIGGDTITTAIRSRLNCSFAEAERLKKTIGAPLMDSQESVEEDESFSNSLMQTIRGTVEDMNSEDENSPEAVTAKAITQSLNSLFTELRRSIEFFESQYRGLSVTRIILGGGTAMMNNLPRNMEKDLGLAVEIIDPLRQVKISHKIASQEQLESLRHQLGVGIGLGLRGLAA